MYLEEQSQLLYRERNDKKIILADLRKSLLAPMPSINYYYPNARRELAKSHYR